MLRPLPALLLMILEVSSSPDIPTIPLRLWYQSLSCCVAFSALLTLTQTKKVGDRNKAQPFQSRAGEKSNNLFFASV